MSKIQFEGLFLDVCEVRVNNKVFQSNLSYEHAMELAQKKKGEVWQYFTTKAGKGYICVGSFNLFKRSDLVQWKKLRKEHQN